MSFHSRITTKWESTFLNPKTRTCITQHLKKFNDFAFQRNGIPLLNQSPFVERKHVEAAYGARWKEFSRRVKAIDPKGRLLNPFFADLLSQ